MTFLAFPDSIQVYCKASQVQQSHHPIIVLFIFLCAKIVSLEPSNNRNMCLETETVLWTLERKKGKFFHYYFSTSENYIIIVFQLLKHTFPPHQLKVLELGFTFQGLFGVQGLIAELDSLLEGTRVENGKVGEVEKNVKMVKKINTIIVATQIKNWYVLDQNSSQQNITQ